MTAWLAYAVMAATVCAATGLLWWQARWRAARAAESRALAAREAAERAARLDVWADAARRRDPDLAGLARLVNEGNR